MGGREERRKAEDRTVNMARGSGQAMEQELSDGLREDNNCVLSGKPPEASKSVGGAKSE